MALQDGVAESSLAVPLGSPPFRARGLQLQSRAKRVLDVALSLVLLAICAPLLISIAIAIRCDSKGRAIFRQRRVGLKGQIFSIFKFRTMTVMEDGAVIPQACLDDPRITRLGRFLRRTSFDELPQLLNVLAGDMSLVGPRPHALAHDCFYRAVIGEYQYRHLVRPGITGWAQVNGLRGATPDIDSMRRRVEFDLWYVRHLSLMLDLRIILRTASLVFRQRNAY